MFMWCDYDVDISFFWFENELNIFISGRPVTFFTNGYKIEYFCVLSDTKSRLGFNKYAVNWNAVLERWHSSVGTSSVCVGSVQTTVRSPSKEMVTSSFIFLLTRSFDPWKINCFWHCCPIDNITKMLFFFKIRKIRQTLFHYLLCLCWINMSQQEVTWRGVNPVAIFSAVKLRIHQHIKC